MEGWQKENCVIYVCVTALIALLYHLSGSFHSLWVLLMLLCVGTSRKP